MTITPSDADAATVISDLPKYANATAKIKPIIHGINDVALSVPTKVGGDGIEKILEVPFSRDEMKGLWDSASTLKEMIKEINF